MTHTEDTWEKELPSWVYKVSKRRFTVLMHFLLSQKAVWEKEEREKAADLLLHCDWCKKCKPKAFDIADYHLKRGRFKSLQ